MKRRLVAVVLVAVAVWLALTVVLFYRPPEPLLRRADAVVVLGAASADRRELGLRLARARIAPVLVVSDPPEHGPLCAAKARFEIVCVEPDPFTTRGEAEVIGRLAARRGWQSLAVVTSNYHAVRAGLLVRRCFHGSVEVLHSVTHSVRGTFVKSLHEWGGLIYALTLARGC